MKYLEEGCLVRINNQLHCLIVKMCNIMIIIGAVGVDEQKSCVTFAQQTKLNVQLDFLLSVKQRQSDHA